MNILSEELDNPQRNRGRGPPQFQQRQFDQFQHNQLSRNYGDNSNGQANWGGNEQSNWGGNGQANYAQNQGQNRPRNGQARNPFQNQSQGRWEQPQSNNFRRQGYSRSPQLNMQRSYQQNNTQRDNFYQRDYNEPFQQRGQRQNNRGNQYPNNYQETWGQEFQFYPSQQQEYIQNSTNHFVQSEIRPRYTKNDSRPNQNRFEEDNRQRNQHSRQYDNSQNDRRSQPRYNQRNDFGANFHNSRIDNSKTQLRQISNDKREIVQFLHKTKHNIRPDLSLMVPPQLQGRVREQFIVEEINKSEQVLTDTTLLDKLKGNCVEVLNEKMESQFFTFKDYHAGEASQVLGFKEATGITYQDFLIEIKSRESKIVVDFARYDPKHPK